MGVVVIGDLENVSCQRWNGDVGSDPINRLANQDGSPPISDTDWNDQGTMMLVASRPVAPVLVSTAVTMTTYVPAFSTAKLPMK